MDVCEPSRLPGYRLHRYNVRPPMQHRLHIRPARKQTPPLSRNRVLYAGLALAVVACGLLWRSGFIPLPQWLSNNGGDALWALMVFVGFGFLFPRASTLIGRPAGANLRVGHGVLTALPRAMD